MATPTKHRMTPDEETAEQRRTRNANHHSDEFLILGHDHGYYYYLCRESGQIIDLKADQHIEGKLIALAPHSFWTTNYGGAKGVDWSSARDSLIRRSHAVGIYDPSRVRGRGAWWDGNRAVLHLGDKLVVGDEVRPLSTPSRYIYEAAVPFHINHQNPLVVEDARELLNICELISWEKPISARYLAGWLAVAPICGALNWRPHIWVTGPTGSGKSWAFNNIVTPLIGSVAQPAQHSTTEAGLRQTLQHDAKPVIFDEAEAKDPRAQLRIDNVLELARSASTEGSPAIIKGNPDGNASTWRIRSCFAFFSINYGVKSKADENRISALSVVADGNSERFLKIKRMVAEVLTEEYNARFLARSIRMIPTIRENARVFAAASAPVLGNQRAGDQIGALLAGAYSLFSDAPIRPVDAEAYIAKQDWSEQRLSHEETDESKCLARILQTIIRVPTKDGHADRSIADLIDIARNPADEPRRISSEAASEYLGMRGVRADPDVMVISVSHNEIARILKDSEWAISWGRTLRRLPGAQTTDGSIRFGAVRSRGIEIPYPPDQSDDEAA